MNTKLKILEDELKNKDWWYYMADDHRDWCAGDNHDKLILAMVKDIGTEGVELYNKYAPDEGLRIKLTIGPSND